MNNPGRPPGSWRPNRSPICQEISRYLCPRLGRCWPFPGRFWQRRTSRPPSARRCLPRGHPPGAPPRAAASIGLGTESGTGRGDVGAGRGCPRGGDARRQVEPPLAPGCAARGRLTLLPPPPRRHGRLVGTNTSCSGPGPRSWPGGGGGALPKGPRGRSSGFPQAHTHTRPLGHGAGGRPRWGGGGGRLPAAPGVSGGGRVCVCVCVGVCGWRRCPGSSRGRRAAPCVEVCGGERLRDVGRGGTGSVVRVPAWETLSVCDGGGRGGGISVSVRGKSPGVREGTRGCVRAPGRVSRVREAASV